MSSSRHPNPFTRPLNIPLGGALAGVMAYVGVTAAHGTLGQSATATTGTGTTTSTSATTGTTTSSGSSSVTSGSTTAQSNAGTHGS